MNSLPARRFVVLARRPGHFAMTASALLDEEDARHRLGRLVREPAGPRMQYALAELHVVEEYAP